MRSSSLKWVARLAAPVMAVVLLSTPAWALFDEPQKAGEQKEAPPASPEAKAALDAGLAAVKQAETAVAGHSGKLPAAAKSAYEKARESFGAATKADPKLALAWNGLGYSSRKLGDYKAALAAYDEAIKLRAGYPEATEYRGEAYLALNRTEDAKQAYLDLFSTNRELAGKLLEAMKKWTTTSGKNKDDVEDMKDFIEERTQIAAQTVALTRESAATGWK